MKITLISPYEDIPAIGLRSISSYLKQNGFDVRMIFLPESESMRLDNQGAGFSFPDNLLEDITGLCSDSKLIGISLMTYHFERSAQLTGFLKKRLPVPVVWGGIHATIAPGECLEHADMVVLGEGEETMLEIARTLESGNPTDNVQNLVLREKNNPSGNPVIRPLIQDLDRLPCLDYDLGDHYVYHENRLVPFTEEILHHHFLHRNPVPGLKGKAIYMTVATRGCPHHCSYCCNSTYLNMYKGQRLVRRRSAANIIEEIKNIHDRFEFVESVQFSDDSFFAASEDNIREFSDRYKREINLPFYCLGSPTTITERKMEMLVDAGLSAIQMGIQTGSERIRKLYERNISFEKVIQAARLIHRFADRIPHPVYDIILDNPWANTEDHYQTLQLCLKIPRPREFQLFSLIIFPGTVLHRKYLDTHRHSDSGDPHTLFFQKFRINYPNIMFRLLNSPLPMSVLAVLCSKPVLYFASLSLWNPVYRLCYWMARKLKRMVNLSKRSPCG